MQQQTVKHTTVDYIFGLKRRSMRFIILYRILGELTEGTKGSLLCNKKLQGEAKLIKMFQAFHINQNFITRLTP